MIDDHDYINVKADLDKTHQHTTSHDKLPKSEVTSPMIIGGAARNDMMPPLNNAAYKQD
jgi:hypothetical protein